MKISLVMRQVHRPGEKAFIDFSGEGLKFKSRETGEKIPMQLFVAAMGASSYTFACAVPSQSLSGPPCTSVKNRYLRKFLQLKFFRNFNFSTSEMTIRFETCSLTYSPMISVGDFLLTR